MSWLEEIPVSYGGAGGLVASRAGAGTSGRQVAGNLAAGTVGPPMLDFEAVALPHAGALYRTAYHLSRNATEAEDLTQETFLRAYRAFGGFRGGNIRSWLFAILRNAFLDECRRRGRSLTTGIDVDDEVVATMGAWAPSAESEALRYLPSEAIDRAFADLPPEWRMVVLLADVEELSYREIAEVMGVPQGTVMSRLHRARKRLQEKLVNSPHVGRKRQNEKSA
jgi:RNA polymerase sigma-70 factor (ECF subfamily)